MTVKMISTAAHVYAGKRLKSGDKFQARGESDARLMRALKRAKDDDEPEPYVPPVRQSYRTKVVEAEKPSEKTADKPDTLVLAKITRRYQRRDLTSEN